MSLNPKPLAPAAYAQGAIPAPTAPAVCALLAYGLAVASSYVLIFGPPAAAFTLAVGAGCMGRLSNRFAALNVGAALAARRQE